MHKIAIIGAGTAGLACAILLARQGHAVTVFEKVPELKSVGAGILLQPSGMAVLRDLGLIDECAALGAPITRLFGTTACASRVILDTRYADWQHGSHGLGIHRATLMAALLGAAGRIHTGVDVQRFEQNDTRVTLFDATHNLGEFDALILTDGTRSVLRTQMQVKQIAKPYPWGALWAIVPTPLGCDSTDLRQWYKGCSQMFGVMPTGATHELPQQQLSSLFWSLPVADYAAWRERGLDAWKSDVLALAGSAVEPFLAQITEPAQLTLAAYADVKMRQWHDGRVIALGDCAHAMSPQLGQGANMALVDAAVLARVWQADLAQTFKDYSTLRRGHLTYYRQASRWLTPLFQSHSRVLPWLRDSALFAARHTSIGRAHTASTLVGGRTGWLRSDYAADDLYVLNQKNQH